MRNARAGQGQDQACTWQRVFVCAARLKALTTVWWLFSGASRLPGNSSRNPEIETEKLKERKGAGGARERSKEPSERWRRDETCGRQKESKNTWIKEWNHTTGHNNGSQNKKLSMNQQKWTCQSCSLQQKRRFTFLSLTILCQNELTLFLGCNLASLFFLNT